MARDWRGGKGGGGVLYNRFHVDERITRNSFIVKPMKGEHLFRSAMALTGQLEIGRINSQPQRVFAFSWAFWVLLITSAYTANLANFFVTKSASGFQVGTIAQAVQLRMSICVKSSSGTLAIIQDQFPRARLVEADSTQGTFHLLNDGKCDILASDLSRWMVLRKNEAVNGECGLFWNGIVQLGVKGGIVMSVDTYCASIISQTVDLHMREMVQDGVIAAIWEKYASVVSLRDCSA
jgi:hypothetical protein